MKKIDALTGEDGKYELRVDEPGEFTMSAVKNGYVPVTGRKIAIAEGTAEFREDFQLSTGASISGRVTESGSSAGAERVIVRAEGVTRAEATTDARGNYTVSGLKTGDYAVMLDLRKAPFQATGMVPTRNVSVKTDTQEVRNVDFVVEAAGEVWGYVMTREKEPISGADIILCTSQSIFSQAADASVKKTPPLTGNSDKDGYYEVMGVPLNKEWRLYSTSKFRAPQLTAPFILTKAQRTARVDIFASNGTSVFGRVVSTDRTPVPDANVICIPGYTKFFSPLDAPQAFRNGNSAEDGTFQIQQLPVGEYQILATKKGFKLAMTGEPVYPDGYTDIHNVEVVLEPVESGEYTVYGTVTNGEGEALSGVRLLLAGLSGDSLSAGEQETTSESDGTYQFSGVSSGLLVLTAEKEGYQRQQLSSVKYNEPTNIVMQAASHVSGTVLVRETGQPPQQCSVNAIRIASASGGRPGFASMMIGGAFSRTVTSTDGKFEFELASGAYTIEARAAGLTPGRTQIEIQAGQELDDVIVYVRQSGGRIQGHVATSTGQNAQGAMVWIAEGEAMAVPGPETEAQTQGIQVGADGNYEFINLPAGTYTVQAKLEGYAQVQSPPIELADGQTAAGINLVLKPGNALEGYVYFGGRAEPGAIVTVIGNGVTEMATSDSSGFYRIERLAAGSYIASAIALTGNAVAGLFSPLHARVDIVEGQTTPYNFGETTNTALEGTCVPPPPYNTVTYAILHMPGDVADLSGLNFGNPMSWMGGGSGASNSIMGLSVVDHSGYFRIDNLVEGEYQLDIFSGDILAGNVQQVFSGITNVVNGQVSQVEVPLGQ